MDSLQPQSPFVQMHLQTGWEFENTSSSAKFLFAQKQGNCSFWIELVPWRQEQKYAAQHLEDP